MDAKIHRSQTIRNHFTADIGGGARKTFALGESAPACVTLRRFEFEMSLPSPGQVRIRNDRTEKNLMNFVRIDVRNRSIENVGRLVLKPADYREHDAAYLEDRLSRIDAKHIALRFIISLLLGDFCFRFYRYYSTFFVPNELSALSPTHAGRRVEYARRLQRTPPRTAIIVIFYDVLRCFTTLFAICENDKKIKHDYIADVRLVRFTTPLVSISCRDIGKSISIENVRP